MSTIFISFPPRLHAPTPCMCVCGTCMCVYVCSCMCVLCSYATWDDDPPSKSHRLSDKNLSAEHRKLLFRLSVSRRVPQIIQAVAIIVCCLPELEVKNPTEVTYFRYRTLRKLDGTHLELTDSYSV